MLLDTGALFGKAFRQQIHIPAQIDRIVHIIDRSRIVRRLVRASPDLRQNTHIPCRLYKLRLCQITVGIVELAALLRIQNGKGDIVCRKDKSDILVFRHIIIRIAVGNRLADPCRTHGRIIRHCLQPRTIIPSIPRLRLLTDRIVIRKAIKRMHDLQGRHQAGVKADDIKCRGFPVRLIDL